MTSALLAFIAAAATAAPAAPLQRFGLFVGSNDGGAGREPLRYAATDAQATAKVLELLGGIAPANATVLIGPDAAGLAAALDQLARTVEAVRAAGARTELVVYYSGHADENGILLGPGRVDYPELRRIIERVPADVRVVILDSCHSGALVRLKGGRRVPAFMIDESTAVRGQAFLTAGSATEAAQESDRIKGSYFTAALLAGLRGAADFSRDGKVTLTEAYQFAFQETLARTERSSAGPQHPGYDIHLAGTGDLVMTDLRAMTAGLLFAADLGGRLYVRDGAGTLIVQVNKIPGSAMELGLEPGAYSVTLEMAAGLFNADTVLVEGSRTELKQGHFTAVQPEVTARRGVEDSRTVPVNLSLVPPLALGDGRSVSYFGFNILAGRLRTLHGFELGLGLNSEGEGVQGVQWAGVANWVAGDADGWQFAGGLNRVGGHFEGLQSAGLVNLASKGLQGVQLSAGLNWSPEVKGLQFGAVNVARVASTQIGLLNLGDDVEAPFGILNLVRNGYRTLSLWGSDLAVMNVGVKLGGKRTYTVLGAGFQPLRGRQRVFVPGGFGVHFESGAWFLDADLVASMVFDRNGMLHATLLTTLRAAGGRVLWKDLSLVAAPTLNVLTAWNGADLDVALLPQWVGGGGRTTMRVWPGFLIGVQWRL